MGLNKNCNTFSNAFVYLLLGKNIPGWVNRMALLGRICKCCFNTPTQDKNSSSTTNTDSEPTTTNSENQIQYIPEVNIIWKNENENKNSQKINKTMKKKLTDSKTA